MNKNDNGIWKLVVDKIPQGCLAVHDRGLQSDRVERGTREGIASGLAMHPARYIVNLTAKLNCESSS